MKSTYLIHSCVLATSLSICFFSLITEWQSIALLVQSNAQPYDIKDDELLRKKSMQRFMHAFETVEPRAFQEQVSARSRAFHDRAVIISNKKNKAITMSYS